MAHTKAAKKSIGITEEQRKVNRSVNRSIKTNLAQAEKIIAEGEEEPAREAVKKAIISFDRANRKNLMHWKCAARRKSHLMKKFNTAFPAA